MLLRRDLEAADLSHGNKSSGGNAKRTPMLADIHKLASDDFCRMLYVG